MAGGSGGRSKLGVATMNVSRFMDKQIQGRTASVSAASSTPASGGAGRLFDFMCPDPQEAAVSHRPGHRRSLHGNTNGITNGADEVLPSYDFQPIRDDRRLQEVVAGGGRILPWQMGGAADHAPGGVVDPRFQGGGAPNVRCLVLLESKPIPLQRPYLDLSMPFLYPLNSQRQAVLSSLRNTLLVLCSSSSHHGTTSMYFLHNKQVLCSSTDCAFLIGRDMHNPNSER